MRVPSSAVHLVLTVGLAGSGSLFGQQMNNPLGQLPTPQKTQSTAKPREQNPAGPVKKNTDLPDPTKDPTKDPALDATKDPNKEPELTPEEPAAQADQTGAAQRAADQPG